MREVYEVEVNFVFDPTWNMSHMTEESSMELRLESPHRCTALQMALTVAL